MPRRNSTVEIVDGKVVFSEEVLSYFESIRTEENSVWIDKYFEYLSDESNLSAEKYNGHHIIPCFSFKDENHKTRTEAEPLADKVKGNIVKLSIHNHLLAHHCLWKIFDNKDSKSAFQKMCGWEKIIEDLSEDELKEIAILKEECAKKNQTDEERKEYLKQYEINNAERKRKYRESHKDEQKAYMKLWLEEHKEEQKEKKKKHYEENKDEIKQKHKEYYENNKENLLKRNKEYKEEHKEYYAEYGKKYREENKEELKEYQKQWAKEHEEKLKEYHKNWYEEHKNEIKKNESRMCFDPIKENNCTIKALKLRKCRNKEKYKDVNPINCIIDFDDLNFIS